MNKRVHIHQLTRTNIWNNDQDIREETKNFNKSNTDVATKKEVGGL